MAAFWRIVRKFAAKMLKQTYWMKNLFGALCLLMATVGVLSSCLNGNDNDVAAYEDTAITGITLGTLNRYTQTTSSKTGNDTVIKTTFTGSAYKMTIDQLGRTIYNQTELPMGTDLKHVVISSLLTKNGGVAFLKSLTSDTLSYISTTDSLDFSAPRTLRVYSSDGTAYRDYTVTLTASQTTGINFAWRKTLESDELKGWTDKHLAACLDTVLLVDRGTIITGSSIYDVKAMRVGVSGYMEFFYMGVDGKGSKVYYEGLDNDELWEKSHSTEDVPELATLIGATSHEIFALGTDGRLKVCTDGIGLNWRDEQLDSDASLLPTTELTMVNWPYAPADSMDYVLLAGQDQNNNNTVLWRKISRYHAPGSDTEGRWVYMPLDGGNRYPLPCQEGLSMAYYSGSVLAVGSLLSVRQSRDQGITWKKNGAYALPDGIEGTRVAMTTSANGELWLVTNAGQVWNGKLW